MIHQDRFSIAASDVPLAAPHDRAFVEFGNLRRLVRATGLIIRAMLMGCVPVTTRRGLRR